MIFYLGRKDAELALEQFPEVGHLVEPRHQGGLADVVVAAFEQPVAVLQPFFPDVFLGRHACECLHLAVECGVTHVHLVRHEGHVQVLEGDVFFDDAVQTVYEFAVQTVHLRLAGA